MHTTRRKVDMDLNYTYNDYTHDDFFRHNIAF